MGVVYRVILTLALMPMNTMSLFAVVPLLMSSRCRVRVEVVVQNYTHAVECTWAVNNPHHPATSRVARFTKVCEYMEREGIERFVENARETYPAFLP